YNSDVRIEGNTGFLSVKDSGRYFLENDIPNSARRGRYRNPRLDVSRLNSVSTGARLPWWTSDWDSYWVDYSRDKAGDRSFYKSTLIVPLTLRNNALSKEFISSVNLEGIDRYIFGYLCLDHRDSHYFDESTDIDIGYIFADLMSVFVFHRMVYTDLSKTF